MGVLFFPVLEPLGLDLDTLAFNADPSLLAIRQKYLYTALYDTIKAIAQQNFAQLNRFHYTRYS